jgi:hypothetical protein
MARGVHRISIKHNSWQTRNSRWNSKSNRLREKSASHPLTHSPQQESSSRASEVGARAKIKMIYKRVIRVAKEAKARGPHYLTSVFLSSTRPSPNPKPHPRDRTLFTIPSRGIRSSLDLTRVSPSFYRRRTIRRRILI